MSDIGNLIRKNRESSGYTLKKLAEMCCISDSELLRIEKGTRKKPNWEILCKIANALEFSPIDYLITSGYITESDMHPTYKIKGLNKLSDEELRFVQHFIDFLAAQKS